MTGVNGSSNGQPPSELDRLDPQGDELTLCHGLRVRILRLRMRQLFRLLRIVTRGGAGYLPVLREAMVGAEEGQAAEVFGTQLLAVALMALPEAEDEAVDFLVSVCEPVGLSERDDKQSRESNDSLRRELMRELSNPEPDDVVSILERVVLAEREDLVALGKRMAAAWKMAAKTGQVPQTSGSSPPTPPSPPGSPEPSTLSLQSTAGTTAS